MSLNFVQGDTAPAVLAVIHDEDNPSELVDLTGCTVRFQMRKPSDHRYTVNSVATVVNAAGGLVSYSWGPNDLSVPGTYNFQWEITYPGGKVQTTSPEAQLTIRRQ